MRMRIARVLGALVLGGTLFAGVSGGAAHALQVCEPTSSFAPPYVCVETFGGQVLVAVVPNGTTELAAEVDRENGGVTFAGAALDTESGRSVYAALYCSQSTHTLHLEHATALGDSNNDLGRPC